MTLWGNVPFVAYDHTPHGPNLKFSKGVHFWLIMSLGIKQTFANSVGLHKTATFISVSSWLQPADCKWYKALYRLPWEKQNRLVHLFEKYTLRVVFRILQKTKVHMIFLIHTLTFLGTLVLCTFPFAPYFLTYCRGRNFGG